MILEVRQKESERKQRCIEITPETDSHRKKLPGQLAVKQEKVSSKRAKEAARVDERTPSSPPFTPPS